MKGHRVGSCKATNHDKSIINNYQVSIFDVEKVKSLQQRDITIKPALRKWGSLGTFTRVVRGCKCLSSHLDNRVYVCVTLYVLSWPDLSSLVVGKLSAKCITQRL